MLELDKTQGALHTPHSGAEVLLHAHSAYFDPF